ncbi:MAG: fibronectin type III-like domain-contianing protein, partial [Pyrinomonadaceae bacterium]
PASEGGTAIADVLFGDYNPNGKLPFTYPRNPNNLLTYDYKLFENEENAAVNAATRPQFEFGTGLSYTTYQYSNLKLSSKTIPMNGEITVSVDVKNTGQRAGKETAILFMRDEVASVSPPGKRVKRFAKIALEPNQTKTLTFKLNRDDLSFIGADNKPTVEAGDFTVMIGDQKAMFTLQSQMQKPARSKSVIIKNALTSCGLLQISCDEKNDLHIDDFGVRRTICRRAECRAETRRTNGRRDEFVVSRQLLARHERKTLQRFRQTERGGKARENVRRH